MISSRLRTWMWGAALFAIALCSPIMMHAQTAAAAAQARTPQFYLRLIFPRPTFETDMTPSEHEQMMQHGAYWKDQFKTGKVLLLGPVDDPKGAFGLAVVECTEAEAHAMADGDPTVKSGMNKFEVMPMRVFLHK